MNKKKLWFRAKMYGWGWYPSSWEGWLVLTVFALLIIISALTLGPFSLLVATPLTIILIYICYKTGEKPRWRWGK
jgi:hypothetical protein